jgi:hypothetical protein
VQQVDEVDEVLVPGDAVATEEVQHRHQRAVD